MINYDERPESEDDDELYEHHRFVVDPGQTPLRLDKFLMDRLRNATRNKLQKAIELGFVRVNDEAIKSNYKVKPLEVVTVALPEPPRDTEVVPESIPLNIVYEDDDLLIVNKEAGMVVHPAYNNWNGTLVNALTYHFQQLPTMPGNDGRPGLVHRIDKDTSGLLVIAKSELAMQGLARQFFDHSIERTYQAIVWGVPEPESGTINVNLGRHPKDRRVVMGFEDADVGRHAITHYKTLRELRYVTHIECKLETGRTHQIRAHFKHIGHPLFNDAMYGGNQILKGTTFSKYRQFVDNCFKLMPRQALHAKSLGFEHPKTGEWMQFNSELPEDFRQVLDKWENYVQHT